MRTAYQRTAAPRRAMPVRHKTRNDLFAALGQGRTAVPKGAPPPGAAPTPPAAPAAPPPPFNLNTDPEVIAARAASARDTGLAESDTLTARRRLLAQLGDRNLASSILGAGDPTLAGISDDPNASTSQLAQLQRGFNQNMLSTDADLRRHHLAYSSTRGQEYQKLNQGLNQGRADLLSGAQGQLEALTSQLTAARNAAIDRITQALLSARGRHTGAVIGG